jgi:hypothetical protein
MHCLGQAYEPDNWLLFIDLSKTMLKAVLLNNEHKLASVPVVRSSSLKKSYEKSSYQLDDISVVKNPYMV